MQVENELAKLHGASLAHTIVVHAVREVLGDFLIHYQTADQLAESAAGVRATAIAERERREASPPDPSTPHHEALRPEILDHVAAIYAEAATARRTREALAGGGMAKH